MTRSRKSTKTNSTAFTLGSMKGQIDDEMMETLSKLSEIY